MALFRYSGSKTRLIGKLPAPPLGTRTIIEPFAGALAYAIHYRPSRIIAADANPLVRELWNWLRTTATVADLEALERARPNDKVDIRTLGLSSPETTLMRLQISGAYVGQLSSFVAYPQHNLRLDKLKAALPFIRASLSPVAPDFRALGRLPYARALAFVDPPYLGTSPNYGKANEALNARDVEAFILGLKCPTIVTYGDDARDVFPRLAWRKLADRAVPILRGGGTKRRREYVSLLRWPDDAPSF